jgi:hypothetical protein
MNQIGPYIAPVLALFLIFRRGSKPRRVKVNSLWRFPIIITVLCVATFAGKPMPGLLSLAMFAVAIPAGAAVGWFSAQHVELTLDSTTGTIMSKPTAFGTALTAAAFVARFAVEYLMKGGIGNGAPSPPFAIHYAPAWVGAADALLLFVAARGLASAWHMWIRTRPLLEQHKAAQLPVSDKS